ncbi:hypothetical protein [Streptomyces sp. NRRL B-24484]|uniref:hypothetical protein n=1 Tax=Streptomyces sp. NRRL B-24484 TaxID=1463833 RepID=UPI0004C1864B|nr:hypothetical protein [Streptomyces sp. NRRL B-24484]
MTIRENSGWDGVTTRDVYRAEVVAERDALADAARDSAWTRVFELLDGKPEWVNATRIGGPSGFAPLHQAAWLGAPVVTVTRLVVAGAWRTLRTSAGERPADIAAARGHTHLLDVLRPVVRHPLPPALLAALEGHLHALVREDSQGLAEEHRLALPQLEVLTELTVPHMGFPIPGMYGGFNYRLEDESLIVESWSRVVGGSGRRHRVTADGATLIAEGFV